MARGWQLRTRRPVDIFHADEERRTTRSVPDVERVAGAPDVDPDNSCCSFAISPGNSSSDLLMLVDNRTVSFMVLGEGRRPHAQLAIAE